MLPEDLDEVLGVLSGTRRVFPYFRDRHALIQLGWACGGGVPVRELRSSRWSRLLTRPAVRKLLATRGDGVLSSHDCDGLWPDDRVAYRVALDRWRGEHRWAQTTRRGHELVVQLNFTTAHDRPFRRLVKPDGRSPFAWFCHPVAREANTLAWARVDLDIVRGEALIEEVQTDWIRSALDEARHLRGGDASQAWWGGTAEGLSKYVDEVLKPHLKLWDEAVLAATLVLLRDEIGVERVWYHTPEGGKRLKRIDGRAPPRSVYTDLPRRFCFEETDDAPPFLAATARRSLRRELDRGVRWLALPLSG